MSVTKTVKQLERIEDEVRFLSQNRRAFLMTDSKGRYLAQQVERSEDIFRPIFRSGAQSGDSRLLQRVTAAVHGLASPLVLVWLVTCDLTKMQSKEKHCYERYQYKYCIK